MFTSELSRIINTGQSRSLVLTGNVYDLFMKLSEAVPLLDFLLSIYDISPEENQGGLIVVTYALNDDVRMHGHKKSIEDFRCNWIVFKGEKLADIFKKTSGNPTYALEVMRQMSICSRNNNWPCDLLFIIESADMLVPEEKISRMSVADRRRVAIIHDWFSDPGFMDGHDSVILITESRSKIHSHVSKLPQVLEVEVPYPDLSTRSEYLSWMRRVKTPPKIGNNEIAEKTAGLSLHALRQLIRSGDVSDANIFKKVEEHIISQLGKGVVEFKVPSHSFEDVIGFSQIKEFFRNELIPAFKTSDKDESLSGAAIGGPIGGGKTFICEALATELKMPVLTLKNIRSKWFGETDIVFERLRRALTALDKVVIFVDEADTVFGSIENGHETEKRLTGKIQDMMSDTRLKGKVLWLLMTARIHMLSPDIRRPGRVGDLIVPILDPTGDDLNDFVEWTFDNVADCVNLSEVSRFANKSAAWFGSLRSEIKRKNCKTFQEAIDVSRNILESDIEEDRKKQKLHALLNCTRLSLLPNKKEEKSKWRNQLEKLNE